MRLGKLKILITDNNYFEKLETHIMNFNSSYLLSELIDDVAYYNSDYNAAVLRANLEKFFTNIAYKMFAENNIALNYDMCADINKLLIDMDIVNSDKDICSIHDGIEDLIDYYKNIDMCRRLENKILNSGSEHLSDLINEVADYNVDFYTDDVFDTLKDLYETEYYDRAISEPDSGDVLCDTRKAQYFQNKDILFKNQERIIINVACRKFSDSGIVVDSNIKYNVIYEKMKIMDFDDNIDTILDKIDDFICEYKDSKNNIG